MGQPHADPIRPLRSLLYWIMTSHILPEKALRTDRYPKSRVMVPPPLSHSPFIPLVSPLFGGTSLPLFPVAEGSGYVARFRWPFNCPTSAKRGVWADPDPSVPGHKRRGALLLAPSSGIMGRVLPKGTFMRTLRNLVLAVTGASLLTVASCQCNLTDRLCAVYERLGAECPFSCVEQPVIDVDVDVN